MKDTNQFEKHFARYLEGDEDGLLALFEKERPLIYDYVLRMTGKPQRSLQALDLVWEQLRESHTTFATPLEWRKAILSLARSLSASDWNANTQKLEHPVIQDELKKGDAAKEAIQLVADVDKALRSLPAPEREVLVLHYQKKLPLNAVAEIMEQTENQVQQWMQSATNMLRLVLGNEVDLKREIRSLPRHTYVASIADSTMALSQMIGNVRRAKRKAGANIPIAPLVLMGVGLVVVLMYTCR